MEIKAYDKNAKKHPKKQLEKIAASLRRFGWQQPIKLGENNVIIVGHGRYLAYQKFPDGIKEPWIVDKNGVTISGGPETKVLSDEEEKAYRLADNKLNESEWDMRLALPELREMSLEMFNLTGFDKDLLIEMNDKDDLIPTKAPAKSKIGDLYELGGHRLLCGDSTKHEDFKKLMNDRKADMVFTDPPYNVNYSGSGQNTSEIILNDKMSDEKFRKFLLEAFKRIAESVKRTAGCYVFHSHKTASDFEMALELAGFTIDTQLIWNKPAAGLGMNHYRTKHEPFFYCSLEKEKTFYGDRTGTTVWKIPDDPARAFKWFQKEIENMEKGESTVWTMKRANVNEYVHPTQKPVELAVTAITKSSKSEDIVLDPFLGSGTTLISAEKSGRFCYGMELDPKYVDTIVQRYCEYTDSTSVVRNGEIIDWVV